MERRVLIAIFASFLVIYLWQTLFVAPQEKKAAVSQTAAAAAAKAEKESGTSSLVSSPEQTAPAAPTAAMLVGENAERDIHVETSDILAVFTNRGARLKSWRLKRYQDQDGGPLELVEQRLPAGQPLPFSLRAPDSAVTNTLNSAVYAVSGEPSASIASGPVTLRFEYRDSDGVQAIKEFKIEPSSYLISFQSTVSVKGQAITPAILWGPGLSDSERAGSFAVKARGLLSLDGKEQRLPAAEIAKGPMREGAFKFAGIDDHYFMSVALNPGPSKIAFEHTTVAPPEGSPATVKAKELMAYTLEPSQVAAPIRFYVGPKDFDQLALVDRELTRAVHFGMFGFIVVPLLRSLKWIHGYIGNYGWSIIILTAIINLLILPLRHKSVVSMRKMQEIQPEAKAIQDRYAKLKATDPAKQKMNQELMGLYRERGVNPASGCVPMLLPFPILIAFYSLLTTAIELRGQPFILWIHDLAAPDPYHVTPILMGATQLWQTWIAPSAGADPAQRKMMLLMPVVFTFLFLGYPSGVALYWFATNLWGILQQYGTNYVIGPPNVRTMRPAAERRVKRVGSGKTEAAAREN